MALLGLPFFSFAQEEEPKELPLPTQMIKMNPWEFIDNTFFMEYEKFNPEATGSWNFGLGFKTGYDWYSDQEMGVKGEIAKRFYIKGIETYYPRRERNPYLVGVFVAFFMRGAYTYKEQEGEVWDDVNQIIEFETNERSIVSFFPGVQLGVTRTFWDILYVEGYVGGGVRYAFYTDTNSDYQGDYYYDYFDVSDAEYRGVAPNIGMKVGVAF